MGITNTNEVGDRAVHMALAIFVDAGIQRREAGGSCYMPLQKVHVRGVATGGSSTSGVASKVSQMRHIVLLVTDISELTL
jgi:hypothetical protein